MAFGTMVCDMLQGGLVIFSTCWIYVTCIVADKLLSHASGHRATDSGPSYLFRTAKQFINFENLLLARA